MNREKLIKAGIDYDEGVARFAGKPEIYEKYLQKLFDADTMDTLMRQLEDGDVPGAFRTAHDLKGNTGSLSVSALYRSVCGLVELLRCGDAPREAYMPAARQAQALYGQAKQAVKEIEHD